MRIELLSLPLLCLLLLRQLLAPYLLLLLLLVLLLAQLLRIAYRICGHITMRRRLSRVHRTMPLMFSHEGIVRMGYRIRSHSI